MAEERSQEAPGTPRWFEDSTRRFLEQIEVSGTVPAGTTAEEAAVAVLCTLLLRVSGSEARQAVRSMPPGVQRLLAGCVTHRHEEPEELDRDALIGRIAGRFGIETDEAGDLMRAVFAAARARMSGKEIRDVASQLPADLKGFWIGRRTPRSA